MCELDRTKALELIRRNIEDHGFHVYMIAQESTPRFAYTIGLSGSIGAELVLAGAHYYFGVDVMRILHSIREQLDPSARRGWFRSRAPARTFGDRFEVRGLGTFTLVKADVSWTRELLLGAIDYYDRKDVIAYQIVPDKNHWTVDVPNMATELGAATELAWRWLKEPWPYAFPENSTATTHIAALRGERVTEVNRWELFDWEMFAGAGPDVKESELRVVPICCLVGADPTLARALELAVGEGIWRVGDGAWHDWLRSSTN